MPRACAPPHPGPPVQANIKEARFGLDFFRSKGLVLNGLDNLEARRHVNRLCVAAGTPLVESGTAGHKGQARGAAAAAAEGGRARPWRGRRPGVCRARSHTRGAQSPPPPPAPAAGPAGHGAPAGRDRVL